MVLNDIINEAATGPPFNGVEQSSPPTVSAVVGSRSTQFRPSISSLNKGDTTGNNNNSNHRRTASSRRKISMMYEDEEGPKLKERLTDACYKGIEIFCVWDCCWAYIKLSEVLTSFTVSALYFNVRLFYPHFNMLLK